MTDDDWKDELEKIVLALERIAGALDQINKRGLRCYTQEVPPPTRTRLDSDQDDE